MSRRSPRPPRLPQQAIDSDLDGADTPIKVSLRYEVPHAERMLQLSEASLRKSHNVRQWVLQLTRAGVDPHPEDVAAALRERPPDPAKDFRLSLSDEDLESLESARRRSYSAYAKCWKRLHTKQRNQQAIEQARLAIDADSSELIDYVIDSFVLMKRPRKSGPKRSRRSFDDDLRITRAYFEALEQARRDCKADFKEPNHKSVKKQVAAKFRVSDSYVEKIIKGVRVKIS